MKDDDFHIPFLHGMIVVAAATIVSMATAHYFIKETYSKPQNTTIFTSQESHISSSAPQ